MTDPSNMRSSAILRGRSARSLIVTLVLILTALSHGNVGAQENGARLFRFGYRENEQYRIVGVNRQQLFVNGERQGESEILTRIRLRVGSPGERDGREGAPITADYRVSEEVSSSAEPFSVDRDYQVSLWQDIRGRQEVPRGSFVPQVRDVPSFPEEPVAVGESWTAPALEVYDFRDGLGIEEPVAVPVDVTYEYLGEREFEGEQYDALRIRYALFYRPSPGRPEAEFFRVMTARFEQDLLWDPVAGRAHYYEESYNLFIQTTDGARLEYRGTADGRVVGAPELDREDVRRSIEESIQEEAVPNATVREDEEGVTIALEDIRFAPDSAELLPSELPKLEWLGEILARYPERDILVTGHTALAGTAAGRQQLSEERAAAVGTWLIERGVRDRSQLMFRGRGAREPVADNATREGRARNRRVEITILEN